MKKRVPDKFWFPWWPGKWIFGSVRLEFNPAERGIWVDLLSFASMDDGHIRANEDTPYLLQQLAGMLIIPEKDLESAINKFIKNKKLTKTKMGTLYVTKWEKYQFSERHKLRIAREQGEVFTPEYLRMMPCPKEFKDMATKKGYVRVSRLRIAEAIGRSLKLEERVHHIDGDDTNEKIENLMLFKNNQDHLRFQHGQECEVLWRGDEGGVVKSDVGVIRKDPIIDNSTLNNNKIKKITFSFDERKFLHITIEDKSGWFDAYPACDIDQELREMREWLLANPTKKKSNYRKFITNWLSREQDKGGARKEYKTSQVGESTHIPSKKEDDYSKAREIKMRQIIEKYQPEIDKAKKAHASDWLDEIDNKIKEEIAEFSREYHKKEIK